MKSARRSIAKDVTVIVTVYNEEKTIRDLLHALACQTQLPSEVVIVDGGSTDNTMSVISNFNPPAGGSRSNIQIKLITKMGNRAVGRNEAIRHAKSKIIACTDAGCIPHNDWLEELMKPFDDEAVNVVAGYYKGKPDSHFAEALIPYVLVMEDKVNPQSFLPATRSMAFTKSIWVRVGGFPEEYSHNEDYVFAHRLKEHHATIVMAKKAIVAWMPRKNLIEAWVMFYRFARGDAEARIFRPKVALIFVRYIGFLGLLGIFMQQPSFAFAIILFTLLAFYLMWATLKNYKYVNDINGIVYLPLLQVQSDIAVMSGTVRGLWK